MYLKSDVIFLTCVLGKFIKVSNKEVGINLFYSVSLQGFTYQHGLECTRKNLRTLQCKKSFFAGIIFVEAFNQ